MDDGDETDQVLEWTVWPARETPIASILVAVVIIAISAGAVLSYGNPWFGAMAFIGLFLAVASHYLPTTYHLDAEKARLQTPIGSRERQWDTVAEIVVDESGVFLSPSSTMNWIARRRGLYLRCPEDTGKIAAFVRRHIDTGEDYDRTD